jgi:iron complex transport system ATP-binding protein
VSAPPRLELDRVTFGYGAQSAVSEVSLTLWPGQFLGLLGPNGSGKSTLLHLAAGLLRPQHGDVWLDGQPLRSLHRLEIARQVAVVPQNAVLPSAFSGWEVVDAGRMPHHGLFHGGTARDDHIVERALTAADAVDLAARRVGELSGGEQQRLLLARALAQEPTVLLLDEPTTHLDLPHQFQHLDLVLRNAREGALAILGVFHDLNLAATYCDAIALMDRGRVVTRGTPEAVLTPRWIAAVYGIDVTVMSHPQTGRPVVLLPPALVEKSRASACSQYEQVVARPSDGRPSALDAQEVLR